MLFRFLSDLVLATHLAFVLFAILGGILVLRWKNLAWLHVPAFLWAALIEFAGWVCPLTPLENWLRQKGGLLPYQTTFLERYIFPILYPVTLTRRWQVFLGFLVLAINLAFYGWIFWRARRMEKPSTSHY